MTTTNILQRNANNINSDYNEVAYLEELETFVTDTYTKSISNIRGKLIEIENAKNFDISKVLNLPDDMIYEISTFLQPEIQYTKKFIILKSIRYSIGDWYGNLENYLEKVPKTLMIDLKEKCNINPYKYVKGKDPKSEWCKMIIEETNKIVNSENYGMRIDKLIARRKEEYSSSNEKSIDKWYKFFLYIITFKKYRLALEAKLKNTDAKLKSLKNKKISVK